MTLAEASQLAQKAFSDVFVGNYVFTEEEVDVIFSYANQLLRSLSEERGNTLSPSYDALLFVAIVNATKEWDADEDAFFENIYRKLLGTDSGYQKVYIHIVGVIQRLQQRGKIYVLDCYKKKYYATIISHALAPKKSIYSFFDLCWQVYCKDMDQQYYPDDSVFELVSKQLGNIFRNEKDETISVTLGSQVYSFMAGIRGLAIDKPDYMTLLLREAICSINKLFSGESLDKSKYLNKLLFLWWQEKSSSFGVDGPSIKRHSSERIASSFSEIRVKYIFDQYGVGITTNAFRLPILTCNPQLDIYIEGKLAHSFELPTKGSGVLLTAKETRINLSDYQFSNGLIDIRVVISLAGEPIFDSTNTLIREFILFKNEKEALSSECMPGNYGFYIPDITKLYQYPENISRCDDSRTYVLNAEEGEVIQADSKTVFFSEEKTDRGLWVHADKCRGVLFRFNNEEYIVVDGNLRIAVRNDNPVSDIGVRYEETSFPLNEFPVEYVNDISYYAITELLEAGEPQKITVFNYSTNKILASISVIKFYNIEITYDKAVYYDCDSSGTVRFHTDRYDLQTCFSIFDDEVSIPIRDGAILLNPPIFKWKIDNGECNCQFDEHGIWYKSFADSSILEIECSGEHSFDVYLTNNCVQSEKRGKNVFKLGQAVYSQIDLSEQLLLVCRVDNSELLPLANVYLKETLQEESVQLLFRNQLKWMPESFVGDADASFKLSFKDETGRTVRVINATTRPQVFVLQDLDEGYYNVAVSLIAKGFLRKEQVLFEKQVCIGNEKELKYRDRVLAVQAVMLMGSISPTVIKSFYIDQIQYLTERDGNDFYSGRVYILNRLGEKTYLNKMTNDDGGYDWINPVRIEMMGPKTCWIVAGLNGSGDIDDFLCEFTLNGFNQICNSDNKYVRGIDYYFIEVRDA